MTKQVAPSVTNPTISDLYERIQDGRLVLRPDFQRKFVWTHEHQSEFIDTILKGFPFPEIYVCEGEIDTEKLRVTQYVIDGQQRLTTIKKYIEGEADKPLHGVPAFADLDAAAKADFVSYKVVVRDMGDVPDETVREIFRRINLTKFQLENVEIQNAIYDGEFIQAAKDALEAVGLEAYGVFRESEFTRMADLYFVLLVMATIENGGYFAQDREVEANVAKFNDEYASKLQMVQLISETLSRISELDLPPDSIWFRKSNFFTLVVEMATHFDSLPEDLRRRLDTLEANILANKTNGESEYSRYYSYMYQATHGRSARVTRSQFFRRDVLGEEVPELAS